MYKSYLIPIGYMVDMDNVKHCSDSVRYPITHLVVFDLETGGLFPIKDLPKKNAFNRRFTLESNKDLAIEVVDYGVKWNGLQNIKVYHGSFDYELNGSCLPLYDTSMNIVKIYGGNLAHAFIWDNTFLKFTFEPFSFELYNQNIIYTNLFVSFKEYREIDCFLPLFNKISDGIYENNGFVAVTGEVEGKSIVLPSNSRHIRISVNSLTVDEIVLNREFMSICSEDSPIFKAIRKVYIGKDSSRSQASQVIESIRISREIYSEELNRLFNNEKFDRYYDYLLSNDTLAKEILDGIDIIVY
jgi:hypothetical protein